MTRHVVLLHGLWMPRASMALLAARLARAGYTTSLFGYPTVRQGPDEAVPRLADCLRAQRAHIVAHSLGGLVALETLHRHHGVPVGRVVCLGSPLHGSAAAEGLAHHRWGAFALGRSAALLREGCEACTDDVEVGVVAGRKPLGFGRWFGAFDGASDGTVAVAETRLEGLADHVTVAASHTGLVLSSAAAAQAIVFLREGRFRHASP